MNRVPEDGRPANAQHPQPADRQAQSTSGGSNNEDDLDLMALVSHRLPLAQADHGLALMEAKAEQIVKAIVEPWAP